MTYFSLTPTLTRPRLRPSHMFSRRSLSNRGFGEVLLLRTTDGGSRCDKAGYDKVDTDATMSSTSASIQNMLTTGLKQMETWISFRT